MSESQVSIPVASEIFILGALAESQTRFIVENAYYKETMLRFQKLLWQNKLSLI